MRYNTQRELQQDVIRRLDAVEERIHKTVDALSERQIAWNPPEGGWGIGQVFEHLCVTDEANFPTWELLIRAPDAPRLPGNDAPWSPRIGGRLVVQGLISPRKSRSPPRFRIGPDVRPQVRERFFECFARVRRLIAESANLEWAKLKHGSSALPILRYNMGDAWLIETVHLERHAGQIERVRHHAQFPQT